MNKLIQEIYDAGIVVGRSGKVHKLHSAIDPAEGVFLESLILRDPSILRTLEVGCAYGLSSLHICLATRDRAGASHTIIDPFQNTHWDGAGIRNLEQAGIRSTFVNLIEVKSEFALPRLLQDQEGCFDFIFIDGWHTFDHTLLDCFYATRLLRVGGVVVIDDVTLPAVRPVVEFLRTYPCYQAHGAVEHARRSSWKKALLKGLAAPVGQSNWRKMLLPALYRRIFDDRDTRMVALKKTAEDHRDWNWHSDAF